MSLFEMQTCAEFDLIAIIAAMAEGLPTGDVLLGIGDDAALLGRHAEGELVVCLDTLNEGIHFAAGDPPEAIGHKALAVNLSDLAAMGATPSWCLLSLSLPEADRRWVESFASGFGALARAHGLRLVGGDTVRGPRSISVTAAGLVPAGQALRRGQARVGDQLWLSGTLGDAGAALAGFDHPHFHRRLRYPTPRLALGHRLLGLASACIDVSDGLRQDLPRLLGPDRGAIVELEALPLSACLGELTRPDQACRLALTAGDDYELAFTASPRRTAAVRAAGEAAGVAVTPVGTVDDSGACRLRAADGSLTALSQLQGFEHFR